MSQRNRLRNRAQYSTFSILFAAVVSVELHSRICRSVCKQASIVSYYRGVIREACSCAAIADGLERFARVCFQTVSPLCGRPSCSCTTCHSRLPIGPRK